MHKNIRIYNCNVVINGIGGKICATGYLYLQLVIGNVIFTQKCYVFDSLPCKANGIIGCDFLKRYQATINLSNNMLLLKTSSGDEINVPIMTDMNKDSLYIPARSESVHFVETSFNSDAVVCASQLYDGVFMASSLVTPNNGKIPIRILNTTEKDLVLGNIQPLIFSAKDYDICSFDRCDKDAQRVKQLLSLIQLKHLNLEERKSIENLCAKYSDIFYLEGDRLTTTNIYKHKIILKPNAEPVYVKPYRLPHSQKHEITRQISDLLQQGIIEPANSDWSSPLLLVPKKPDSAGNKKFRLVIDYRKLNNTIIDDKFPLPNITEILDSLSGCIYFTHLDLHQGYYNVDLEPSSRKYTAFSSGQYQLTRMPMGLKTSPSSFSRMMTMAMSGLTYEKCFVYQDDLVVFGKNLNDHCKNLQDVFTRLRKVNLKLNPQKCDFLKKEILYLGHVVSKDGVLPDPEKITTIKNYPQPQNTEDVRRFVAFANYYRKFINNFAALAYPLNKLSRKNVIFNWDTDCAIAFNSLKEKLISSPVLQYPDLTDSNTFIVQTDASGFALGAVLANQNGKPVAYASRGLNKSEIIYPTIEKELLAIVWAVKHFRPYLYGRRFIIRTDHKPLVYLFNMRDPSSRLLKFRLALEEYDFTVEYVRGKENAVADALSRICVTSKDLKEMNEKVTSLCVMTRAQYREMQSNSSDIIVSNDDWPDQPKVVETHNKPRNSVELRLASHSDLDKLRTQSEISKENKIFIYVLSRLTIYINPAAQSQLTPSDFARELRDFCQVINVEEIYMLKQEDNKMFIEKLSNEINKCREWSGPRLCIVQDVKRINNKDDRRVILNDFHLLPTSGHAGIRRMVRNIKKYYFWPGIDRDVTEFVKRCHQCQKQKYTTNIKEPMTITTTAHSALQKIYLDLVGPLDKDANNYCYILTLQCELSKYVEAYPLVTKSSTEVARALVNNYILRYGIPTTIATDRGTEFMSAVMNETCKLLQINNINSTAYHHESIGALENSHKHLGAYLRIQTENHPEAWSSWLPFWCFSYNTSVHSSTNYTPYELVFGKKCSLPHNLTQNIIDPLYNSDHYPLELKYRLQVSQKEARDHLIQSKITRKNKYDEKVKTVVYKKDDLVLLKNETGNKLSELYSGPYSVIRDLSPNVELLMNGKSNIVHKNRTKLFVS